MYDRRLFIKTLPAIALAATSTRVAAAETPKDIDDKSKELARLLRRSRGGEWAVSIDVDFILIRRLH